MIHRQTRVACFHFKSCRDALHPYNVSMRGAYQVQYILIYRILTSWISFLLAVNIDSITSCFSFKQTKSHHHRLFPVGRGEFSQIDDSLGVAPLVVVPRNNLQHVVTDDHRQSRVDSRGLVGASEIDRDQRFVADGQDALQRTSR